MAPGVRVTIVATVEIVVPGPPDLPACLIQGAIEVPALLACHVAVGAHAVCHSGDACLLPAQLACLGAGDLAGASTLADAMVLAMLPGIHPAAGVRPAVVVPRVLWIASGEVSMSAGTIRAHLFAGSSTHLPFRRAVVLATLFDACTVTLLHTGALAVATCLGGTRKRERCEGEPDDQSIRRLHDGVS